MMYYAIGSMPKSEEGRLFAVKVLELFRAHLEEGSAVREIIDNLVQKMAVGRPDERGQP